MLLPVYRCVAGLILSVALLVAGCSGGGGGGGGSGDSDWLVPQGQVVDGGPGIDGIPAIENPQFESAATIDTVAEDEIVVVTRSAGEIKAYPLDVLDYHEIVNDGPADAPFTLSYCPLTASSVAWKGNAADADRSYGVSGLLYNSNLVLYDRATDSLWSQMLQRSINGSRIRQRPETFQVIETTFATLKAMYPDARVLTRNTGHQRNYDNYPYGDYRTSNDFLFPPNRQDNRLQPKVRLIGIHNDTSSKVYELGEFGDTTLVINDQFATQSIVVVGNSALDFAVIFDRELADGTILSFAAVQDDLPNIMADSEGNTWDIFGIAVSGPRAGEQLESTNSYVAMWFAWVAHFGNVEVHFN